MPGAVNRLFRIYRQADDALVIHNIGPTRHRRKFAGGQGAGTSRCFVGAAERDCSSGDVGGNRYLEIVFPGKRPV